MSYTWIKSPEVQASADKWRKDQLAFTKPTDEDIDFWYDNKVWEYLTPETACELFDDGEYKLYYKIRELHQYFTLSGEYPFIGSLADKLPRFLFNSLSNERYRNEWKEKQGLGE